MANHVLFTVLMITLIYFGCCCCAVDDIQKTIDDNNDNQMDQDSIMAMCNETFRTSMG